MENRLPLPSNLARHPPLGKTPCAPRECTSIGHTMEARAPFSWLQSLVAPSLIMAGGLLHRCTRIITGGPFPWAFLLSLPLVCPTPAEKWTSGAGSAPTLPFSSHKAHRQPGHCDTLRQDWHPGLLKSSGALCFVFAFSCLSLPIFDCFPSRQSLG